MKKFIQYISDSFQNLTVSQKRMVVLAITAIFVVILTFSVVFSLIYSSKQTDPVQLQRSIRFDPIPAQELFLPDEPDFVPGVLLERERRSSWTGQDASAFWRDPLMYGEEQWREKIETAVDRLLENVP
ncbi:MAG: hypothetical protein FWC03_01515 [Treponema sp.]|nr:hypothetical protein [Treponema sp.]